MNRSRNSRAGSLRSFTSTPGPVIRRRSARPSCNLARFVGVSLDAGLARIPPKSERSNRASSEVAPRGHERSLPTCTGHIDRMHEAPSDHRRWCHQNDDARPLAAGWIAVTILAASVTAPGAVVASQELQRCASPVRVAISPPVGGFNVKR